MPAAAVASRTPATGGISGTSVGARGEIAVAMMRFRNRRTISAVMAGIIPAIHVFSGLSMRTKDVDARDKPGHDANLLKTIFEVDLLLGGRSLGVRRLCRVGLGRLGRLVHALDLRGGAQLCDVVGLRLAHHI